MLLVELVHCTSRGPGSRIARSSFASHERCVQVVALQDGSWADHTLAVVLVRCSGCRKVLIVLLVLDVHLALEYPCHSVCQHLCG